MLGRHWFVFLQDDSRFELRFDWGSRSFVEPKCDLVVRIDRGPMIAPGSRFRLEGFVVYGSFRSSHRCPLVQWVTIRFSSWIRWDRRCRFLMAWFRQFDWDPQSHLGNLDQFLQQRCFSFIFPTVGAKMQILKSTLRI